MMCALWCPEVAWDIVARDTMEPVSVSFAAPDSRAADCSSTHARSFSRLAALTTYSQSPPPPLSSSRLPPPQHIEDVPQDRWDLACEICGGDGCCVQVRVVLLLHACQAAFSLCSNQPRSSFARLPCFLFVFLLSFFLSQCFHPKCTRAFHPICGRNEGMKMFLSQQGLVLLCDKHTDFPVE